MKNKLLRLCLLFLFGTGMEGLHAQAVIPTAGGNASGSGGSVSWSAGQVFYNLHTGDTCSVAEGVQQPYEISVVTAVEEAGEIKLMVSAYPNPAADYLILKTDECELSDLSFRLFDLNGKLLRAEKITTVETSIAVSNLEPSVYLLKVLQGQEEIKTFKIIKH